jgi:hypothetical protein
MTRQEVIERTRDVLDDKKLLTAAQIGALAAKSKPLTAYLSDFIDDALYDVLLSAPIQCLITQTFSSSQVGFTLQEIVVGSHTFNNRSVTYKGVGLTTNNISMVRFAWCRCASWKREVHALNNSLEPCYQMQKHAATMATIYNPMAFTCPPHGQYRYFELYPYTSGEQVQFSIVPLKLFGDGNDENHVTNTKYAFMNMKCDELLVYTLAAKVMTFFRQDITAVAALAQGVMAELAVV